MKSAYIIVEGEENAIALQRFFPKELWQDVEILGRTYRSSAISLAGTLMSKRSRPVLLLVDAKSHRPEEIREETQTVEFLLLPASTAEPYRVIPVVPSIAAVIQDLANAPNPQQHLLLQQIHEFLSESLATAA
jgi:hypothetical protein